MNFLKFLKLSRGWEKSRFTVVSMQITEFILVLLFINYCITFQITVNLLLPHPVQSTMGQTVKELSVPSVLRPHFLSLSSTISPEVFCENHDWNLSLSIYVPTLQSVTKWTCHVPKESVCPETGQLQRERPLVSGAHAPWPRGRFCLCGPHTVTGPQSLRKHATSRCSFQEKVTWLMIRNSFESKCSPNSIAKTYIHIVALFIQPSSLCSMICISIKSSGTLLLKSRYLVLNFEALIFLWWALICY